MLSLTVDTFTAGDLPPAGDGFWIAEVSRPGVRWNRTRVGSPFLNGSVQVRATKETSELAVVLYAHASTSAGLQTLREQAEDVFGAWAFTLALSEDGVSSSFSCDCADMAWNAFDRGMADAHLARLTLSIPCYPTEV